MFAIVEKQENPRESNKKIITILQGDQCTWFIGISVQFKIFRKIDFPKLNAINNQIFTIRIGL